MEADIKTGSKNIISFKSFIPCIFVALVFIGVILSKGIFPFGHNTIDYYDMGQTNAPMYFHIWDVLHGKDPLLFSWYINEGQNLAMGSAIQWNISPFNLYFLFIPRNLVFRSLSIYVMLHLIFMTASMQFFLFKVTGKTDFRIRAAFAAAYGLCGFTLTHYTIPTYLDSAVFLPLLIWLLFRLILKGKYVGYILMLGFTAALSYYLTFMHLIFILMIGGACILFILEKDLRRERAGKLVLGTLCGLCLSAFITLPAVLQLISSARFNSNMRDPVWDRIVFILRAIGADQYYVKFWQLYAMEAAICIILAGIIKYRKLRKQTLFSILFFFVPCALIPFEAVNLIWHFGIYYHYPIRCGYLIPFSLLATAAFYAGEMPGEDKDSIKPKYEIASAGLGILIVSVLLFIYFKHDVWEIKELFKFYVFISLGFFAIYAVIFLIKKIPDRVFTWFLLAQLVIGAAAGYGTPHFTDVFFSDPEQNGAYIETSLRLKAELPLSERILERIKNPDTSLNANYGMVLRRATISGWANTLTPPMQNCASKLGYTTHFMRILDSGGTVFTDALLGVTEIVTRLPYGENVCLYEYEADNGLYYLYSMRYTLPFFNCVTSLPMQEDGEELSIVDIQNTLFTSLLSCPVPMENVVYTKISEWLSEDNSGKGSDRDLYIDGHRALYLIGGSSGKITVNGKPVTIPTIGDMDNTEYPAWFNSNTVFLGEYKDETVSVQGLKGSKLFTIDIDALNYLSERLNSIPPVNTENIQLHRTGMSFDVTADREGENIIFPMDVSGISRIRINSREGHAERIAGVLTAVPLDKGFNHITLSTLPKGFSCGLAISLAAFILLVFCFICLQKSEKCWTISKGADIICFWILRLCWFLAALCIYLIPVTAFFVHEVIKHI